MILNIPSSNLHEEEQELNLSEYNVCTLIGENGSGKSSILETIFEKYSDDESLRIISFSSGQNERFSKIYSQHKTSKFKKITQVNSETLTFIDKFYFDKNWVKILVFFATSLFDNRTRRFLKDKYIDCDENDDLISKLNINIDIPKFYTNIIQDAYKKEETDPMHESVRRTYVHSILTKIIEASGNTDYDFETDLKINFDINAKDVYSIFEADINKIFTFLALTNYGATSMFEISNANLFFKNSLEFNNLSDGEYQLLAIYSLLDLFDSSDTLFLFDEIDSHLHYNNIKNLWRNLKNIEGKLITTTHISESILNNNFKGLTYLNNGKIEKELTANEVFSKLSIVTGERDYNFKIASKIEHIALLDDIVDWLIFKKLIMKKLGEESLLILDKVIPYKRSSSYNDTNEIFGKGKLQYVNDFKTLNQGNISSTKNIFLICDRDKLSLTEIYDDLQVNINREFNSIKSFNSNQTKTHLLSWKRLEIENYLLSKSMLLSFGKLEEFKNDVPFANIDVMTSFDGCEDISIYDAKNILHPLYKSEGFDEVKLDDIIDKIPQEEISDDIEKMYYFIKTKVEN